MWTYANVRYYGSLKNHWRRDALTQRLLHDTQKRNKLRGRQNASAKTRKNQILQGAGQVAKKNCDAEVDVESGLRKPDCGRAEKELSIVICQCRPAAGFAPQHQQTGRDKQDSKECDYFPQIIADTFHWDPFELPITPITSQFSEAGNVYRGVDSMSRDACRPPISVPQHLKSRLAQCLG